MSGDTKVEVVSQVSPYYDQLDCIRGRLPLHSTLKSLRTLSASEDHYKHS